MASKIKKLSAEDVEIMIKNIERSIEYLNSGENVYTKIGYLGSSLPLIVKQLKGEYPII